MFAEEAYAGEGRAAYGSDGPKRRQRHRGRARGSLDVRGGEVAIRQIEEDNGKR